MPPNEHFSKDSLPVDPRQESAEYETLDAHPGTVLLIAGVIAGGVALSLLIAGWVYHRQLREPAGEVRQTSFRNGSSQRTSIATDWATLDRESALHLENYGWVDRSKGVVRVPIARAMDLLVAEAAQSPAKPFQAKVQP